MPLNVITDRFEQLLAELSSPSDLPTVVRDAKRKIDERLLHGISIRRSILIGSFASGTALQGYSDVDYLLALGVGHEQESNELLRNVASLIADALTDSGPQTRCPAVVVEAGEYKVDLVPARKCASINQFPVYLIPDCRNGWQESNPEAHIARIDRVDGIFVGALRRLIRLAKIWKYRWSLPISSYKMERLILDHSDRLCEFPYDHALHRTFELLHESESESILDDGWRIAATSSARDQSVQDTRATLVASLNTSSVAIAASASGDEARSMAAWNEVFCGGLLD